jgi:hypothetical protein
MNPVDSLSRPPYNDVYGLPVVDDAHTTLACEMPKYRIPDYRL